MHYKRCRNDCHRLSACHKLCSTLWPPEDDGDNDITRYYLVRAEIVPSDLESIPLLLTWIGTELLRLVTKPNDRAIVNWTVTTPVYCATKCIFAPQLIVGEIIRKVRGGC